jgi:hypothetical protein
VQIGHARLREHPLRPNPSPSPSDRARARPRSAPARSVPTARQRPGLARLRVGPPPSGPLPLFDRAAGSSPAPTADRRGRRAQTPSRLAGTQSTPLARTLKGRAFTAASTAACLIPSGANHIRFPIASMSILEPLVFDELYAAANTRTVQLLRMRYAEALIDAHGSAQEGCCTNACRPAARPRDPAAPPAGCGHEKPRAAIRSVKSASAVVSVARRDWATNSVA